MFNFLKMIFTWWNKQTLGTFLYTLFTGKFAGSDEFGNKYYYNSENKRWVVYNKRVESTKIPPEWHMWIHFLNKKVPTKNQNKYDWQKKYEENLTGTSKAYRPEGSLLSEKNKSTKKYDTLKN